MSKTRVLITGSAGSGKTAFVAAMIGALRGTQADVLIVDEIVDFKHGHGIEVGQVHGDLATLERMSIEYQKQHQTSNLLAELRKESASKRVMYPSKPEKSTFDPPINRKTKRW